ncbi:hypothetical protein RB653_006607 [Dictyostelium firmibasis]|uniref:HEAT repeat domain-containing protein n=1 Tax=Dictyostelium firmibasis TaxID=79012 RepID=A0AAN7TM33_9MYCE
MSESITVLINECIKESFIEFKEVLEDEDTILYLCGLISESESFEEIKEQFNLFCQDFDIPFKGEENEVERVFNQLINLLKRKGCISFSIEGKPKSHLVCNNDSKKTILDLNDPNLTMEQYLSLTYSDDSRTRLATLRTMCPCKVKADIDQFYDRIIEMSKDSDRNIRYQAMHNLCDGSPAWREEAVIQTLESMHNDSDPKIRRRIHNILTHYKHTEFVTIGITKHQICSIKKYRPWRWKS